MFPSGTVLDRVVAKLGRDQTSLRQPYSLWQSQVYILVSLVAVPGNEGSL